VREAGARWRVEKGEATDAVERLVHSVDRWSLTCAAGARPSRRFARCWSGMGIDRKSVKWESSGEGLPLPRAIERAGRARSLPFYNGAPRVSGVSGHSRRTDRPGFSNGTTDFWLIATDTAHAAHGFHRKACRHPITSRLVARREVRGSIPRRVLVAGACPRSTAHPASFRSIGQRLLCRVLRGSRPPEDRGGPRSGRKESLT
jgi:hypothetical protein